MKKTVYCYIKQTPKLPKNAKSFIVLPDHNCFCCSCPEERAVKQFGEPDYYLESAGKEYIEEKNKPVYGQGYGEYGAHAYGGHGYDKYGYAGTAHGHGHHYYGNV